MVFTLIFQQFTNWTRLDSKTSWFNVRPSTNISIPCKQKNKKSHERNWSSSKTTAYFTSNIFTIYKLFIRPHLNYGGVVYDQHSNDAFSKQLETVQYNAALAIMGAIKGTSREKLYHEVLGLEYLQQRRWMSRLCLFYKVVSTKLTAYTYNFIPPVRQSQRHPNTFNSFSCRTEYFKNFFSLRYRWLDEA